MGHRNKGTNMQAFRGSCLTGEKLAYIRYKTCGNSNPYYKNSNFYYSHSLRRNLNRCIVEDYWSDYLSESISINPNESLTNYYNTIVVYIKSMYITLTRQERITYSNLSIQCSVILLIKRVLVRLLGEEESLRIIALLKLDINCDCD